MLSLIVLTVAGLGVLLALDTGLKSGLWGEWGFAFAVCWLGIWWLGRALGSVLGFTPPRFWQAPIFAALPLVAAPFAALTWWPGFVLLVGLLIGLILLMRWLPWNAPEILRPVQWMPVLGAIVAVWAFVAVGSRPAAPSMAAATPPVPDALGLAYTYRPLLFFDSHEIYFPMNIVRAMKTGLVEQCTYGIHGPADCGDVATPAGLSADHGYLAVDSGALGAPSTTGGRHSAFYVHALRKDRAVFLDYWIYYAENPNPVGKHLLCAPGLQWSELTCFEHAGDWEGLVVVLEPCNRSVGTQSTCRLTDEGRLRIAAVEYAAHRGLTRFTWNALVATWRKAGLGDETSERPLVFVARDSHASYPRPCASLVNLQTILGRLGCSTDVTNGALAWQNNGDTECAKTCLLTLPTTADGAPASWDTFAGYWGEQTCILYGGYCDRGTAPRSPAFQSRYKQPWHTR